MSRGGRRRNPVLDRCCRCCPWPAHPASSQPAAAPTRSHQRPWRPPSALAEAQSLRCCAAPNGPIQKPCWAHRDVRKRSGSAEPARWWSCQTCIWWGSPAIRPTLRVYFLQVPPLQGVSAYLHHCTKGMIAQIHELLHAGHQSLLRSRHIPPRLERHCLPTATVIVPAVSANPYVFKQ